MDNKLNAPVMDVTAPPQKTVTDNVDVTTAPTYETTEFAETDVPTYNTTDEIIEDKPQNIAAEPEPKTDQGAAKEKEKDSEKPKAVTQKKTSSPNSSVGLAIIATVVIVFGLAAIATYAYMQQNS